MTILFEITTRSGDVFTGSVQGSGGRLGGGAAHLGRDRATEVARREMERLIAYVTSRGAMPPGFAWKKPGCCIVYPVNEEQLTYEEVVAATLDVPLAGASFRIPDRTAT